MIPLPIHLPSFSTHAEFPRFSIYAESSSSSSSASSPTTPAPFISSNSSFAYSEHEAFTLFHSSLLSEPLPVSHLIKTQVTRDLPRVRQDVTSSQITIDDLHLLRTSRKSYVASFGDLYKNGKEDVTAMDLSISRMKSFDTSKRKKARIQKVSEATESFCLNNII